MDAVFTIIAIVTAIVVLDLFAIVLGADSRDGFREDDLPAGIR
jgi:hypothetical protein